MRLRIREPATTLEPSGILVDIQSSQCVIENARRRGMRHLMVTIPTYEERGLCTKIDQGRCIFQGQHTLYSTRHLQQWLAKPAPAQQLERGYVQLLSCSTASSPAVIAPCTPVYKSPDSAMSLPALLPLVSRGILGLRGRSRLHCSRWQPECSYYMTKEIRCWD